MEIKVTEEAIQKNIDEVMNQAIQDALKGHSVSKAIEESFVSQLQYGVIAEAIKRGMENIDTAVLSERIAEEIQRAAVKGVIAVIEEGFTDVLMKVKDIPSYSDNYKKEREKIKQSIFNK